MEDRFLFGLAEVQAFFHCGTSKAHKLTKTILAPAVLRCGNTIMVDKAKALDLIEEHTRKYQQGLN